MSNIQQEILAIADNVYCTPTIEKQLRAIAARAAKIQAVVEAAKIINRMWQDTDYVATNNIAMPYEKLKKAIDALTKIAEAQTGPGFSCHDIDHTLGLCSCADKAAAIRDLSDDG